MNEKGRTALLVGATGLVGSHVLQLILADSLYERVRVISRRKLPTSSAKLNVVLADFESLNDHALKLAADDVFCCLGTTIARAGSHQAFARVDRDYPIEIARLAKSSGAQQFLLVSSVGANPNSPNFYLRTKAETEAGIAALGYDALQILRPSLLLGERPEFRWKEKLSEPFARLLGTLMIGSLAKYRPIEATTVASVMVNLAKRAPRGINVFEGKELQR